MNAIYFLRFNAADEFEAENSNLKNTTYRVNLKNLASKIAKDIVLKIACEIYGKEFKIAEFKTQENGKPYLQNLPNFHFNISHSENVVAVAISDSSVGIDVEKIRKVDRRVAKRKFSENERNFLNNENFDYERAFFEIWTKKEAFLKQSGKGITVPLDSFDVTCKSLKNRFFTIEKDGFIISVFSDKPDTEFVFEELYEKF